VVASHRFIRYRALCGFQQNRVISPLLRCTLFCCSFSYLTVLPILFQFATVASNLLTYTHAALRPTRWLCTLAGRELSNSVADWGSGMSACCCVGSVVCTHAHVYLRNRLPVGGGCVYVLHFFLLFSLFFIFCFFLCFFPSTKTMRQPFSGTAERIFMKLSPNDREGNVV